MTPPPPSNPARPALRLVRAAIAVAALTQAAVAQPSAPQPPAGTLAHAATLYEQALEHRAAGDEPAARATAAQAADAFQILLVQNPHSPALHRNLALAQIHAGQLGHGIAALRRAAALDPHDPTIAADLAAARARVQTRIQPQAPTTEPLSVLRPLARPALLWTSLAILATGWTLLLLRILLRGLRPNHNPPIPGHATIATTIALGTLATTAALAALWSVQRSTHAHAVLIADDTLPRTGPSATAFPPAFDQPLSQGVEIRITEQRGDWIAATLADGQAAWFPASAVEPITPLPNPQPNP